MYRSILLLAVCACALSGAPQPAAGAAPAAAPDAGELVRRARRDSAAAGPAEADTEPAVTETEARTPGRSSARAPRPRPAFASKLGSFAGPRTNLLERLPYEGYRKFTSSCRCEKIWNCPRLQITTPRCPDEYFLCCDL